MSDFLKKGLKKVSKVTKRSVSQNVTPSASTSTEHYYAAIQKIDWALEIANILKDISEGSQLLAPLKASCALMIRGLEITRVKIRLSTVTPKTYRVSQECDANRTGMGWNCTVTGEANRRNREDSGDAGARGQETKLWFTNSM